MQILTPRSEEVCFLPGVESRIRRRRFLPRHLKWLILAGGAALALCAIGAISIGAVRESRKGACVAQLKKIGLAMHSYHDEHSHFPSPSINRPDGTPLLSWRVAVLPQLGYRSLYERFHLDEPWDSPHNRPLLAQMPKVYACPGGPSAWQGLTGYQVVVGPKSDETSVNTAFIRSRGVDLREMTDGTSNTALIVETDTTVPWTKPEDLSWKSIAPPPRASVTPETKIELPRSEDFQLEQDAPLPRLASPHEGGAYVLLADGSVRFIKATVNRLIWRGVLTMNGGEVLSGG